MRVEHVYVLEGKKNIDCFLGVDKDTFIFTQYAGNYDDGSTRSAYKKTFAERMFNKAAKKAVETVKSEKVLFQIARSKINDVVITPIDPIKVGGYITYSTMISFTVEGKAYSISYNSDKSEEVDMLKELFS